MVDAVTPLREYAPFLQLPLRPVWGELTRARQEALGTFRGLKNSLAEAIHCSQMRSDQGVLKTPLSKWRRTSSYLEILEYSYLEYFYAFPLPYFAHQRGMVENDRQMIERCDLRSYESSLRKNSKLRVFHCANDFLLRPNDVAWLEQTFSDRFHLFPDGGHLGNLYRRPVQERIAESFLDLTGERAP